jgi:hypothetical protein
VGKTKFVLLHCVEYLLDNACVYFFLILLGKRDVLLVVLHLKGYHAIIINKICERIESLFDIHLKRECPMTITFLFISCEQNKFTVNLCVRTCESSFYLMSCSFLVNSTLAKKILTLNFSIVRTWMRVSL